MLTTYELDCYFLSTCVLTPESNILDTIKILEQKQSDIQVQVGHYQNQSQRTIQTKIDSSPEVLYWFTRVPKHWFMGLVVLVGNLFMVRKTVLQGTYALRYFSFYLSNWTKREASVDSAFLLHASYATVLLTNYRIQRNNAFNKLQKSKKTVFLINYTTASTGIWQCLLFSFSVFFIYMQVKDGSKQFKEVWRRQMLFHYVQVKEGSKQFTKAIT